MEATIQELVRQLKQRQGDRTQAEFAKFLGISQPMLSRLYRQERNIGLDTFLQIARRYPDLAFFFLSQNISTVHQCYEGSQSIED